MLPEQEYLRHDATSLAALVRQRDTTASELVETALAETAAVLDAEASLGEPVG